MDALATWAAEAVKKTSAVSNQTPSAFTGTWNKSATITVVNRAPATSQPFSVHHMSSTGDHTSLRGVARLAAPMNMAAVATERPLCTAT